jgi:rod shape-determining protein MreC
MIDTFSRRRPLTLLATVVVAQLLLLAFQIKGAHDVRLIRYWAVALVTPFERVGTWTLSKVGGAWGGYVGLRNARAENMRLYSDMDKLRLRNRELESRAAEAQRLELLLNFRELHPEAPMLAAQVIGSSADPTSHTLFINRGEREGLRLNMGVVTPDGIVGKIVEILPGTAQVLLINDKDSGVGALFTATRTHGVVRGSGDPEPRMDYIVNDEKVQPGDAIVTSGEDRIFPKDFPIGTVESNKPANPFQMIRVRAAVRLDRLEDVMVLLTQKEVVFKKPENTAAVSEAVAPASPAPQSVAPPQAVAPAPQTAAPAPQTAAPANPPAPAKSSHKKRR